MPAKQRYCQTMDDHLRLALRHVRAARRACLPWEEGDMEQELLALAVRLQELGAPERRSRRKADDAVCGEK